MTQPIVVEGVAGLEAIVGKDLGPSDPFVLDQAAVNAFADATSDHQWIHVDPERARAESPYGGPIVHGYFVLSLIPNKLFHELLDIRGMTALINYGADKLRFPDVTPVGALLTLRAKLEELRPKGPGMLGRFSCAFTVDGASKPSCAAEILILFAGSPA